MSEQSLSISTADGPMDAFIALPEGEARGPALLVAQEAFGVNAHIKEVCRRLAREGYVALAPELFHRSGKGVVVDYDQMARVMPLMAGLTNHSLAVDAVAGLAALRAHPRVDPARVGVVGFCLGGFVSFLAACRAEVAVSVAFYGGGIVRPRPGLELAPLLGEADRITAPILMHFGAADTSITKSDIEAIKASLKASGKEHEVVVHPGAGHGFACDARASFNAVAAGEAWKRTFAWLAPRLGAG